MTRFMSLPSLSSEGLRPSSDYGLSCEVLLMLETENALTPGQLTQLGCLLCLLSH